MNECPLYVSPYSNALKTAWHIRSNNVFLSIRIVTLPEIKHCNGGVGVTPGVTQVTRRVRQDFSHLIFKRTSLLLYLFT